MRNLLTVVVLAVIGFFAYHYFFGQTVTGDPQATPPIVLSDSDTEAGNRLWLVERASIATDSGITGFSPGTQVEVISKSGESIIVDVSGVELEIPARSLTNSKAAAQNAQNSDREAQLLAAQKAAATPVKREPVASNVSEGLSAQSSGTTGPIEQLHLYVVAAAQGGIIGDPILMVGSSSGMGSAGGAAGESFAPITRSGNLIFLEGYPATREGSEIGANARRTGSYQVDGRAIPKWTWVRGSN